MPENNIVTNKFGLSMVMVSGGAYVLLDANEASKPIPLSPENSLLVNLNEEETTDLTNKQLSAERFSVYISNKSLVQNNINPGEQFFYQLYEGSNYESGLAQIVASGNRYLLDRKKPIFYFDGESKNYRNFFNNFTGPKLFLQVSPPENIQETLVYGNSVPCTSSSGTISSIVLQNNTLLGCKDNEIQSIDGNELSEMFSQDMVKNLSSMRLTPTSRPTNPPRGTIIYNNISNTIEFYNGNTWVTL